MFNNPGYVMVVPPLLWPSPDQNQHHTSVLYLFVPWDTGIHYPQTWCNRVTSVLVLNTSMVPQCAGAPYFHEVLQPRRRGCFSGLASWLSGCLTSQIYRQASCSCVCIQGPAHSLIYILMHCVTHLFSCQKLCDASLVNNMDPFSFLYRAHKMISHF